MTLRNPNANESVEDYDKLQTVEINANTTKIDVNTTKIGSDTLVGSILYRLGIIKDYVIESGSNSNGNYEKWASGKLVQWGKKTVSGIMNAAWGSNSNIYYFTGNGFTYPVPFVDAVEDINSTVSLNHFSGATPTMFIPTNTETKTKTADVYIGKSGDVSSSSTAVKLKYNAIGRWKA